jgi:hypothetical protein
VEHLEALKAFKANCLSYPKYKVKTLGAEVAPCFLQPFELFHNGSLIQHLAFKEIIEFKQRFSKVTFCSC